MTRTAWLLMVGWQLSCVPAFAKKSGFTSREIEVKARRFTDAQNVGKLAERAQNSILARQGGWSQFRTGETRGWVQLLSLRFGNPDPAKN